MTAKPKTGKMTNEDILLDKWAMDNEDDEGNYSELIDKNTGYRKSLLELIKLARQQGRAEQDKRRDIPNKNRQSMAIYRAEKQAYANGFKEGEIKGLSESITVKGKSHLSYYQQGYALGQSDLSARLMNERLALDITEFTKWSVKDYLGMIGRALAEATKEGDGK